MTRTRLLVPQRASLRLPLPFAERVVAEHPPGHCMCIWVWAPAIGGWDKPFALKFRHSMCLVRHP
jgi:hypothetical protein